MNLKKKEDFNMSKGKYGTSMNSIEHIKKANRIPCDCERCRHSRRGAGTLYCELRDAFNPNKKYCKWYWCTKPVPKNRKKKGNNKKAKNKRNAK